MTSNKADPAANEPHFAESDTDARRFLGDLMSALDEAAIIVARIRHGKFIFVSNGVERALGYKPADLVGQMANSFAYPEGLQNLIADNQRQLLKGGRADVVYRALHRDGRPVWMRGFSTAVQLGPDGQPAEFIAVTQEATAEIEAQIKLSKSEQESREILENISDVVRRYDSQGRCLYVSPSIKRVLGLDPSEELVQQSRLHERVHPEDRPLVRAALNQFKDGADGVVVTFRTAHADGHEIYVEATMNVLRREANGKIAEIVTVTRDVTQRKSAEEALKVALHRAEGANRAKSRFLANMNHELRTPLNAIIGFSEMLRQQMFGPLSARYKVYAEMIHQGGEHLLEIITDVLDMAKIEAGTFTLRFRPVDLAEIVSAAVELLTNAAQEGRLRVESRVARTFPQFEADPKALKQILINLLSNAIKFTGPEGTVTISAERNADSVVLCVADTGIGIEEHDLPRLTQAFEQSSDNPHHAQGGAGLGLALVRSLVELHRGTLEIQSVLGQGTTVSVRLPIRHTMRAVA